MGHHYRSSAPRISLPLPTLHPAYRSRKSSSWIAKPDADHPDSIESDYREPACRAQVHARQPQTKARYHPALGPGSKQDHHPGTALRHDGCVAHRLRRPATRPLRALPSWRSSAPGWRSYFDPGPRCRSCEWGCGRILDSGGPPRDHARSRAERWVSTDSPVDSLPRVEEPRDYVSMWNGNRGGRTFESASAGDVVLRSLEQRCQVGPGCDGPQVTKVDAIIGDAQDRTDVAPLTIGLLAPEAVPLELLE